jgi:hypothetical protein
MQSPRRALLALLLVLSVVTVGACATGSLLDTGIGDGGPSPEAGGTDAGRDVRGAGDGAHDTGVGSDAAGGDASDAAQEAAGDDATSDDASDATMADSGDDGTQDADSDAPFDSGLIDGGGLTRYGNVAPFAKNSSHAPNDLLGSPLNVPVSSTLVAFGVIARSSGPQIIMALYTDSGGQPGTLVAQTSPVVLNGQTMEISAPSVAVPAGNYWIMGVYDVTASIGIDYTNLSAKVDYTSLNFGSMLPSPFPAPTTYTGQQFNYYIVVQ